MKKKMILSFFIMYQSAQSGLIPEFLEALFKKGKVIVNPSQEEVAGQEYTVGERVLVTLTSEPQAGKIESIIKSEKDFVYAVRFDGQKPHEKCHMCRPEQLQKLPE